MIRKRHMYLSEEIINQIPNITCFNSPSLDARQEILKIEIPKLGKEAALKAIKEWNQPLSSITHLIFCTSSSAGEMPGADHQLTKLLGLPPSVQRLMIYQGGCFAAGLLLFFLNFQIYMKMMDSEVKRRGPLINKSKI